MNRTAAPPSTESIAAEYDARQQRHSELQRQLERRCNRLSNWRALAFAGMVAALLAGWMARELLLIWLALAAALLAVFVVLVRVHGRALAAMTRAALLAEINRQALARVQRCWSSLPTPTIEFPPAQRALAKDLDLFGRASLYQLLSPPHTPSGVGRLARWLLEPAAPDEIVARQQGVAGLSPALDWRQELDLSGRMLGADEVHPERFVAWAESRPLLVDRPALDWLARFLPLLLLALVLAQALGYLTGSWWLLAVAAQVTLSFIYCGRIHAIYNRVSTRQGEIRHYRQMFALAAAMPHDAPELNCLADELRKLGGGAHVELAHLGRIMDLANLRFTPLVYGPVQMLTLWDLHVLRALERWQARSGQYAARWFDALGRLEALSALASLHHDHPDWSFPSVNAEAEPRVAAERLGHPLLSNEARVVNDVSVGPPGTFLLVTGSNMSGKSTLLRSLGTNIVLAQAGAPVCAARFEMPPLSLATSMRVQDSLEDGVSFFLAELKRLKEAVDAARQLAGSRDRRLFYLFDEILQGTNTVERQIAVRTVLKHLLEQGAIGAISTHDLELANSSELSSSAQSIHFRESFAAGPDGQRMTFDYRLRPGVATTTNALKLLELVGLGEGAEQR